MNGLQKDLLLKHFFSYICSLNTEVVAQLVRALDCGSRGRGFETHHPPSDTPDGTVGGFLFIGSERTPPAGGCFYW
jgi:hypothetical protein